MPEPISEEYRQQMVDLARAIDQVFNGDKRGEDRDVGFVLLMFPYGLEIPKGKDRCNYISNGANRNDVIVLFKEMIARFEGQAVQEGRA